jgi:hypothetical protein
MAESTKSNLRTIASAAFLSLGSLSLIEAGCSVEGSDVSEGEFGLVSAQNAYCPAGFRYAEASRQCENASEMLGPFPAEMIAACRATGGGEPCGGRLWARDYARTVRGNGLCPKGTAMDSSLGYCTSGSEAFGPFAKADVASCKSSGGGPACEDNRWSKLLLRGQRASNPLQVPYVNQYDDATVNPNGSCGNTSTSMLLRYYGIRKTPDEVRARYGGGGDCGYAFEPWQCPEGLSRIQASEGLRSRYTRSASRATIKGQIDAGRPVIVHGNWTSVGHIMVFVGYNDATRQWIVNDPAGRWCGEVYGGYSFCGGDYESGALLRYSYAAMSDELLGADGDIWISTASRSDFSL